MSLNYELPEGLTNNTVDGEKLQSLCFNMMFVGVNNLKTDEDIDQFWNRYTFRHRAIYGNSTQLFLDREFVISMKGLTINVSKMTRLQFIKDVARRFEVSNGSL